MPKIKLMVVLGSGTYAASSQKTAPDLARRKDPVDWL